ncbi:uncharacterized protein [Cicer arietinum]|uniref:uncharacterized protein n=1 Tax=Cicer arietinum TaxID=3827 RepID=UPI003CC58994
MVGTTKFDIEKFNGSNDFSLWKIKMHDFLVQQGLVNSLKGESTLPTTMYIHQKEELIEKGKKKPVTVQIVDFNKILDDLENLDVKLDDEDKALILFNAMPSSYEHFNNVTMFGREQTITLEEVHAFIQRKESYKRHEIKNDNHAESLDDFEGENNWVLGSGCTIHMCPRNDYFKSIYLHNGGVILLGNNKSCTIQGKSKRVSFGVGQHNTSRSFEYVHSDLWGPSRTHFGCSYFITIIDDYSRKICKNEEHQQYTTSNKNTESVQIEVESLEDQEINHEDIPDTSLDDNATTELDLVNFNLKFKEMNQTTRRKSLIVKTKKLGETAMNKEMQSLEKNQTWTLVDISKSQRHEGINFNEVFALFVKHCSIKILLLIVNQQDLEFEQLDVKTTFLHGDLEETMYMQQPKGSAKGINRVCLLKKSLYGLKKSSKQWYRKFDDFMIVTCFQRCSFDSCIYILKEESLECSPTQEHFPAYQEGQERSPTYLLIYVDDILLASSSKDHIKRPIDDLNNEFEMTELGEAKRILGMDIKRNIMKGELFLSQVAYLKKVFTKYRMHEARHVTTP